MTLNCLPLPIDSLLPEICDALRGGTREVIIRASPGSGKTTRVPPMLLDVFAGEVWVLEPRRLAARLSAQRVASELPKDRSDLIGWQMRFSSQITDRTRLTFLTEGMFPFKLAANPTLRGIDCIVIDEFHERHLQTDVAFALVRELQHTTRPDLRLIVMSATLDVAKLRKSLPNALLINVDIPLHPVAYSYLSGDPRTPLADKVWQAIDLLAQDNSDSGHILVFLPGTADIKAAANLVERRLNNRDDRDHWAVLQLRASLNQEDQYLVFSDLGKRKVILATNVAESAITIPGITGVIDSGLARIPTVKRGSSFTTLETKPVSQASLIQRAGRAGRTGPGRVVRLMSAGEYAGRPAVEIPEILREDLAPLTLTLLGLKTRLGSKWNIADLPWLDPPERAQWDDAFDLLRILGIVQVNGTVAKPHLTNWPVHPRIARFLDACTSQQIPLEGAWLAAIMSEHGTLNLRDERDSSWGCDLLAIYDIVTRQKDAPHFSGIKRTAEQLIRLATKSAHKKELAPAHALSLAEPLLAAFPDRVSQLMKVQTSGPWRQFKLCTGGDARLSNTSSASHHEWIIALDLEVMRALGSTHSGLSQAPTTTISLASGITTNDLLAAPSGWLNERSLTIWDPTAQRVRATCQTIYANLIVEESRQSPELVAAACVLLKALKASWPKPFENDEVFQSFIVRSKLLASHGLIHTAWDPEELKELLLSQMCDGKTSFAEIAAESMAEHLRASVGENEWRETERFAPTSIKVGNGFSVQIQYDTDQTPWIGARLQNFFGQRDTPRILNGKLALVVHLLAPNARALQVTQDLANFCQNTYQSLRNEYQRKYPRHYWPDNPLEAEPPVRGSLKPRK